MPLGEALFAALSAGGTPAVPVFIGVVETGGTNWKGLFAALSAGGTPAVPVFALLWETSQ